MTIDCSTFVKSILAAMWMLNDLPRSMRKDLETQLGLIWVLISDPKVFPTLTFTRTQQQRICQALAEASQAGSEFKFTFEALQNLTNIKVTSTIEEEAIQFQQDDNHTS